MKTTHPDADSATIHPDAHSATIRPDAELAAADGAEIVHPMPPPATWPRTSTRLARAARRERQLRRRLTWARTASSRGEVTT